MEKDSKATKKANAMKVFCERVGDITLFDYQINFLIDCLTSKRVVGVFSRQTGKTMCMSLFALYKALQQDNFKIVIIAPTDRQAGILIERSEQYAFNSSWVKPFIETGIKREMKFINGSSIKALSTGDTGATIRGQTADLIILEESAFIKSDIVSQVIMPMIAATQGDLIQISTPFSKNHFYKATKDPNYKVHQTDYTQCPNITEDYIKEVRENMTAMEFAMEFLAQFVDDSDSYFSLDLINSCIEDYELHDHTSALHPKSKFVCGADFAAQGKDDSVQLIVEQNNYTMEDKHIRVCAIFEQPKTKQTENVGQIKYLHSKYYFEKVYCDYTGLGEGPVDFLIESLGSKVEGSRFTVQSKEDMYSNLKILMESGRLKLPNHKKLLFQLADLQYERTSSGNTKIHHRTGGRDDCCDALALACLHFKPKRRAVFHIS